MIGSLDNRMLIALIIITRALLLRAKRSFLAHAGFRLPHKIKAENIRRNARRHIRQLWGYIDSQMRMSEADICPGIIFSRKTRDIQRLHLVESISDSEGIQIVWHDEPIDDLRERMKRKAL